MPGFGVAGVTGIVLEAVAVYLTWSGFGATAAIWFALGAIVVIVIAVAMSMRSAVNGRLSRSRLILKETEQTPAASSAEDLTGASATALTDLRPSGFIRVDGKRVSAMSGGEYIRSGSAVRVTGMNGATAIVVTEE